MATLKTAFLENIVPRAGSAQPSLDNTIVVGLLGSPTGLGQSARLCAASLQDIGHRISALDLCGRFKIDTGIPFDFGNVAPKPGPGILILHINAPQISRALWHLGRPLVRDKLIVGYWAWELEGLPPEWLAGARFVHEIWAPSRFSGAAFARAISDRPVHVVPHIPALRRTECMRERQAAARTALGLPPSAFVVAFGFAMLSGFERKNPLSAIAAFKLAFGVDPGAQLILRCLDLDAYPAGATRLLESIAGWDNIRLVTDVSNPMGDAIEAADVYLSLHRSEGFGLTLIEAMAAGKPVVATGWSGNMDFMSASDSVPIEYRLVAVEDPQGIYRRRDDRWADPNVRAAATALERLRRDGALRAALGASAAAAAHRFAHQSRAALRSAVQACAGIDAPPAAPETLLRTGVAQ